MENNFSCFFWYHIFGGNVYGWLPKPQIRKLCQNIFAPNLGLVDRYRAHCHDQRMSAAVNMLDDAKHS